MLLGAGEEKCWVDDLEGDAVDEVGMPACWRSCSVPLNSFWLQAAKKGS